MFYFSTSATVGVTSNSGKSSARVRRHPPVTEAPNGCVVSFKIDGTRSSAATGAVASRALQCPGGSTESLAGSGNARWKYFARSVLRYLRLSGRQSRLFVFPEPRHFCRPSWGGGGQFLSSGFFYFHFGSGGTCGTDTSCLTSAGWFRRAVLCAGKHCCGRTFVGRKS